MKDGQYCKDLYDEINYQHSVSAKTGIQYLEALPLHYIQDFIIYGNNIVLLENKQADKNYSIASSTAYFDKSKILEYREMFNHVWNGKYSSEKPRDVAATFLEFYKKTYT